MYRTILSAIENQNKDYFYLQTERYVENPEALNLEVLDYVTTHKDGVDIVYIKAENRYTEYDLVFYYGGENLKSSLARYNFLVDRILIKETNEVVIVNKMLSSLDNMEIRLFFGKKFIVEFAQNVMSDANFRANKDLIEKLASEKELVITEVTFNESKYEFSFAETDIKMYLYNSYVGLELDNNLIYAGSQSILNMEHEYLVDVLNDYLDVIQDHIEFGDYKLVPNTNIYLQKIIKTFEEAGLDVEAEEAFKKSFICNEKSKSTYLDVYKILQGCYIKRGNKRIKISLDYHASGYARNGYLVTTDYLLETYTDECASLEQAIFHIAKIIRVFE